MSEELIQTIPTKIGKYQYYKLGSSTLLQLVAAGIIKRKDYGILKRKKPDGLLLLQNNIKAVVEYKLPEKLSTKKQIAKAIKQEIEVAKALCKILIVTDGTRSFWVNALNGEFIQDSNDIVVSTVFNHLKITNTNAVEYLIENIDASIRKNNSKIRAVKIIDPTPLATRLWQTIWVATGKSPVKCLYNVVELFIFKFLSDLKVLNDDVAFNYVFQKANNNPREALDYYARNTRVVINRLFPEGADGTTIINGTIFVNENGEANLSQSILFRRSLDHLNKYTDEFGSLTKIDKNFKTKLYESFLKQEVEALGQYFTPRKVIQSIIRMAGIDEPSYQFNDKRICDPFCGVGGFLLEILNLNDRMKQCYVPIMDCSINVPFVLNGFDKGFERDDERTIILAKANMLIYLAEILFTNPSCCTEYARIFNSTFTLFRDNLGTFGHIILNNNEKYDVILSNPPYVTTGSSIIKEEIKNTPHTKDRYPINALGLESISIEWIINSLKPGGEAYLIVPDGILARINGKKLRNFILRECYLDAIISLPERTFFANFENTYILAITKKHNAEEDRDYSVFTYLVSNIGERLTSIKREDFPENDLPEMERLFRIFKGARDKSKDLLERETKRCKIFPIEKFKNESHWVIDRWWSNEDKIGLKILDQLKKASKSEIDKIVQELTTKINDFETFSDKSLLRKIKNFTEIKIGDNKYFNIILGDRIKKDELAELYGDIPAYSANVNEPFGYINRSNISDFSYTSIIWSIDGNFEFNVIQKGVPFATTDHCGTIQILNADINPEYLLFALYKQREEESFNRAFRASVANVKKFKVLIPINKKRKFDILLQKQIAENYVALNEKKQQVENVKMELDNIVERFLHGVVP